MKGEIRWELTEINPLPLTTDTLWLMSATWFYENKFMQTMSKLTSEFNSIWMGINKGTK